MKINSPKIVIDTNIIISALLMPNSTPNLAIQKALNIGEILMSPETWIELENVIKRPKFNRYITYPERQQFLLNFSQTVTLILNKAETINECRDEKDNKYLELAVSGQADYIITGDKDLLVLHPFRFIYIITVQEFLANNSL